MGRGNRAPLEDFRDALWESKGSDLLLTAGVPPLLRVDGQLQRMADQPLLAPEDTERLFLGMLTRRQSEDFAVRKEIDFSFTWRDQARFRVNGFRQRGSVAVALRMIPY